MALPSNTNRPKFLPIRYYLYLMSIFLYSLSNMQCSLSICSPHGSQMSSMNMSRQSTTEYYSDTVPDFETPTIESIKSINPDITGPSPAKIRWMDAFQKVCRQINQVGHIFF